MRMQRMKTANFSLLTLLLANNIGCRSTPLESLTQQLNRDARVSSFFSEFNAEQRQVEFARLDIERQYLTYLCGNQKIHPPTLYLAESFAKVGAQGVPFLMAKLYLTKSDMTIRDIIYVFAWMQRLKTYNVVTDKLLIGLLWKKTSEIHDDFWRGQVYKEIEGILSMPPE
ncbi:MAG: hypothetical protein JWQ01_299 [Massilia sp.]|nr:hypothetical protein [Massilia sp.]